MSSFFTLSSAVFISISNFSVASSLAKAAACSACLALDFASAFSLACSDFLAISANFTLSFVIFGVDSDLINFSRSWRFFCNFFSFFDWFMLAIYSLFK